MGLHFVERPNERGTAGLFAVLNEAIFWGVHEKEFGRSLSCYHSETLHKHFLVRSAPGVCDEFADVRAKSISQGIADADNAHSRPSADSLRAKRNEFAGNFEFRQKGWLDSQALKHVAPGTLAIHLRGTDKRFEVVPPSLRSIRKRIQLFVSENNVERIFLATDDRRYLRFMEKSFPELLIPRDFSHLRKGLRPLHLSLAQETELFGIDRQALCDAYILSKCDYFLYSFSNLSHFALILGAETHRAAEPLGVDVSPTREWAFRLANRVMALLVRLWRKLQAISK